MNKTIVLASMAATLLVLSACKTAERARPAFAPSLTAAQQRQLDSRKFDTNDEAQVINAIVAVFQDLGYKLEETDLEAGLVSASKDSTRGQGLYQGYNTRITSTTTPTKDGSIVVRTTYQSMIQGSDPRFTHALSKVDADWYQQFYDKLSQSLFLEAHKI